MTGQDEQRVTYPVFLRGPAGELVLNYRSGRSGNGDTIFNVYDETSASWRRLVDGPLLIGEGRRNAYPVGLTKGPDGCYHYTWVWRELPPRGTGEILNHDLSYARSRDLVHWETAGGAPLALPITLGSPGAIVDPVPSKGGIINSSDRVGFESKSGREAILARVVVACSGDSDVAARAGAPFAIGRAEDGRCQPTISTYVLDYVPQPILGTAFGFIAAGSAVGGILMNQAVVWTIANLSYDYCFYAMVALHPLALTLIWRYTRRSWSLAVPPAQPAERD